MRNDVSVSCGPRKCGSNLVGARIPRGKVITTARGSSSGELEGHASSRLPPQPCSWGQSSGRTCVCGDMSSGGRPGRKSEEGAGLVGLRAGIVGPRAASSPQLTLRAVLTGVPNSGTPPKGRFHLPFSLMRQGRTRAFHGLLSLQVNMWGSVSPRDHRVMGPGMLSPEGRYLLSD